MVSLHFLIKMKNIYTLFLCIHSMLLLKNKTSDINIMQSIIRTIIDILKKMYNENLNFIKQTESSTGFVFEYIH